MCLCQGGPLEKNLFINSNPALAPVCTIRAVFSQGSGFPDFLDSSSFFFQHFWKTQTKKQQKKKTDFFLSDHFSRNIYSINKQNTVGNHLCFSQKFWEKNLKIWKSTLEYFSEFCKALKTVPWGHLRSALFSTTTWKHRSDAGVLQTAVMPCRWK